MRCAVNDNARRARLVRAATARLPHPQIEWVRHSTRVHPRSFRPARAARPAHSAQSLDSAEADRLEIRIGLDDLAQPIFGRAIAAICVGVMTLHQRLELP